MPELDKEEMEPDPLDIEQHRLIRLARAAIPAQEGQQVVEREAQRHVLPFHPAEAPRRFVFSFTGTLM